jgi:DNA-binding MarR family transcriptional regulator
MGVTQTSSRSAARLALVTNPPPVASAPLSDVPAGLRLLRTLDRSVLEVARDVNLRPMELYALLLLDEHDQKAMTTRRLSEVLASSPSQAKQIALRLAARGYVERGGGHGRTTLTPMGRELAERATDSLRDEIAARVARIESGAVAQASHALGSLLLD